MLFVAEGKNSILILLLKPVFYLFCIAVISAMKSPRILHFFAANSPQFVSSFGCEKFTALLMRVHDIRQPSQMACYMAYHILSEKKYNRARKMSCL